jgi:hypothetical protein
MTDDTPQDTQPRQDPAQDEAEKKKKRTSVPDAAQLANFDWLLRRLFGGDRAPPPGASSEENES